MDFLQFMPALAGGLLVGLSAAGLMFFSGNIAGISGITFSAITAPRQNTWGIVFIIGIILGAGLLHKITGLKIPLEEGSITTLWIGAFLVGLGTRIGSGCTSGHGICGLGRFSIRSLVATVTFMTIAIITVFIRLHILG